MSRLEEFTKLIKLTLIEQDAENAFNEARAKHAQAKTARVDFARSIAMKYKFTNGAETHFINVTGKLYKFIYTADAWTISPDDE